MSSTTYLSDTNVVSELVKPRPHPGVVSWAEDVAEIALSVVSVEEILYGLAWKPKPRIEAWFTRFFDERCHLLPITFDIVRQAGHLRGALQGRGKPRTQSDMLIAATAQVHGLTLVTRNVADFEGCGVSVLNPFSGI